MGRGSGSCYGASSSDLAPSSGPGDAAAAIAAIEAAAPPIPRVTVHSPQPCGPAADHCLDGLRARPSGPFYEHGESLMDYYIEKALRSLPRSTRLELREYLGRHSELLLGSMCSGSDCPMLVGQSFQRVCRAALGVDVSARVSMQCEKNPAKQQFLLHMFDDCAGAPLFADVGELGAEEAHDVRSGSMAPVGPVHLAWIGFPCTDVSRKNPRSCTDANRRTVLDQSLRTGSAFQGLLQYYAAHGSLLQLGFCENVSGLGDLPRDVAQDEDAADMRSNLDWCVRKLSVEGRMWCIVFGIDPAKSFQSKVSRFRYWIPHIPLVHIEGVSLVALEEKAVSTMNFVAGAFDPLEIDDLLLREDDALVLEAYDAARAKAAKARSAAEAQCQVAPVAKRRKGRAGDWPGQHVKYCEEHDIKWWEARGPPEDIKAVFPGLYDLTQRELEVISLKKIRFPERAPGSVDVSQGLSRAYVTRDKLGCASPSMKNYLLHRCRISLGLECMQFQGLHYGDKHPELRSFSGALLQDIGGNAFEALARPAAPPPRLLGENQRRK